MMGDRYNLIALSCRSVFCYRNPGFAIIYSCHRRKDRKFELFMRHRGWGSSVLGVPSQSCSLRFRFPSLFYQGMKPRYTMPWHATQETQVVPISRTRHGIVYLKILLSLL